MERHADTLIKYRKVISYISPVHYWPRFVFTIIDITLGGDIYSYKYINMDTAEAFSELNKIITGVDKKGNNLYK